MLLSSGWREGFRGEGGGWRDLPASGTFSNSYSLKESVCHGAV